MSPETLLRSFLAAAALAGIVVVIFAARRVWRRSGRHRPRIPRARLVTVERVL